MPSFTTTNNLTALSSTRLKQIVSNQLSGREVELNWFEALCDFLTNCFSCCSNSEITNEKIIHAAKGLVAVQMELCTILADSSPNPAAPRCSAALDHAWEHAEVLASSQNEANQYPITLYKNSSEETLIWIRERTRKEPIFFLRRWVDPGTGRFRYMMVTIPEPRDIIRDGRRAKGRQLAVSWVTERNRCILAGRRYLYCNQEKAIFYETDLKLRRDLNNH